MGRVGVSGGIMRFIWDRMGLSGVYYIKGTPHVVIEENNGA